jgi:hypothetical protein
LYLKAASILSAASVPESSLYPVHLHGIHLLLLPQTRTKASTSTFLQKYKWFFSIWCTQTNAQLKKRMGSVHKKKYFSPLVLLLKYIMDMSIRMVNKNILFFEELAVV